MALDLNHLTESERDAILTVLRRDDALRKKEIERIRDKSDDLETLKTDIKKLKMQGVIRPGQDAEKTCARCRGQFGWIFNKGQPCPLCRHKVCEKCRENVTDGKNRWLCTLCYKTKELEIMSGHWFTSKFRRSKRNKKTNQVITGSEIVKTSIKHRPTSEGSTTVAEEVKRALSNNNSSPKSQRSTNSAVDESSDTQSLADAASPHRDLARGSGRRGREHEEAAYPQDTDRALLLELIRPKRSNGPIPENRVERMRVSSRRYKDSDSSSGSEPGSPVTSAGRSFNQTDSLRSSIRSHASSIPSSEGRMTVVTDTASHLDYPMADTQSWLEPSPTPSRRATAHAQSPGANRRSRPAMTPTGGTLNPALDAEQGTYTVTIKPEEKEYDEEAITKIKFKRVSIKRKDGRSRSPSPETRTRLEKSPSKDVDTTSVRPSGRASQRSKVMETDFAQGGGYSYGLNSHAPLSYHDPYTPISDEEYSDTTSLDLYPNMATTKFNPLHEDSGNVKINPLALHAGNVEGGRVVTPEPPSSPSPSLQESVRKRVDSILSRYATNGQIDSSDADDDVYRKQSQGNDVMDGQQYYDDLEWEDSCSEGHLAGPEDSSFDEISDFPNSSFEDIDMDRATMEQLKAAINASLAESPTTEPHDNSPPRSPERHSPFKMANAEGDFLDDNDNEAQDFENMRYKTAMNIVTRKLSPHDLSDNEDDSLSVISERTEPDDLEGSSTIEELSEVEGAQNDFLCTGTSSSALTHSAQRGKPEEERQLKWEPLISGDTDGHHGPQVKVAKLADSPLGGSTSPHSENSETESTQAELQGENSTTKRPRADSLDVMVEKESQVVPTSDLDDDFDTILEKNKRFFTEDELWDILEGDFSPRKDSPVSMVTSSPKVIRVLEEPHAVPPGRAPPGVDVSGVLGAVRTPLVGVDDHEQWRERLRPTPSPTPSRVELLPGSFDQDPVDSSPSAGVATLSRMFDTRFPRGSISRSSSERSERSERPSPSRTSPVPPDDSKSHKSAHDASFSSEGDLEARLSAEKINERQKDGVPGIPVSASAAKYKDDDTQDESVRSTAPGTSEVSPQILVTIETAEKPAQGDTDIILESLPVLAAMNALTGTEEESSDIDSLYEECLTDARYDLDKVEVTEDVEDTSFPAGGFTAHLAPETENSTDFGRVSVDERGRVSLSEADNGGSEGTSRSAGEERTDIKHTPLPEQDTQSKSNSDSQGLADDRQRDLSMISADHQRQDRYDPPALAVVENTDKKDSGQSDDKLSRGEMISENVMAVGDVSEEEMNLILASFSGQGGTEADGDVTGSTSALTEKEAVGTTTVPNPDAQSTVAGIVSPDDNHGQIESAPKSDADDNFVPAFSYEEPLLSSTCKDIIQGENNPQVIEYDKKPIVITAHAGAGEATPEDTDAGEGLFSTGDGYNENPEEGAASRLHFSRKLSSSYEQVYDDVSSTGGREDAPLSPNAYNFVRGIREDLVKHNKAPTSPPSNSPKGKNSQDIYGNNVRSSHSSRARLFDYSLGYDADNDLTAGSLGSDSEGEGHPLATFSRTGRVMTAHGDLWREGMVLDDASDVDVSRSPSCLSSDSLEQNFSEVSDLQDDLEQSPVVRNSNQLQLAEQIDVQSDQSSVDDSTRNTSTMSNVNSLDSLDVLLDEDSDAALERADPERLEEDFTLSLDLGPFPDPWGLDRAEKVRKDQVKDVFFTPIHESNEVIDISETASRLRSNVMMTSSSSTLQGPASPTLTPSPQPLSDSGSNTDTPMSLNPGTNTDTDVISDVIISRNVTSRDVKRRRRQVHVFVDSEITLDDMQAGSHNDANVDLGKTSLPQTSETQDVVQNVNRDANNDVLEETRETDESVSQANGFLAPPGDGLTNQDGTEQEVTTTDGASISAHADDAASPSSPVPSISVTSPARGASSDTDGKQKNEKDDNIDELFASHATSASQSDRQSVSTVNRNDSMSSYKSSGSMLSPFSRRKKADQLSAASRESIMSYYSDAGEVNYGKIPVSGEILFGLDYNYKAGTLEILVKQCKDLAPVDTKKKRSDPYVKTYLLPDKTKTGKKKTRRKKHTLNPTFDEKLKYTITKSELETRTLWVTVWHNDTFGRNDFLGEVTIPLDYYAFDDPTPKWHKLEDRKKLSAVSTSTFGAVPFDSPSGVSQVQALPLEDVEGNPTVGMSMLSYKGDLLVALKFTSNEHLPASKKKSKGGATRGELSVLVKKAHNLTAVRSNGTSDPFCKVYLLPERSRNTKQKSHVVKKNCNPEWNHTFTFEDVSWEDLRERCLELTIWDHDRFSSNEFLGGVRLGLGTGNCAGKTVDWMDSRGDEISVWQNMLDQPNYWIEGTLPLRPKMA